MADVPLHGKTLALLLFMHAYSEDHGRAPSVREMAEGIGAASTNGARYHLRQLQFGGYVRVAGGMSRAASLTALGAATATAAKPEPIINLVGSKDAVAKAIAQDHDARQIQLARASALYEQARKENDHLPDDMAVGLYLMELADKLREERLRVVGLREQIGKLQEQLEQVRESGKLIRGYRPGAPEDRGLGRDGLPHAWVWEGARCWYQRRPSEQIAGVVRGKPWGLGDGTWVVRVELAGGLGEVKAAAVHCLARRV